MRVFRFVKCRILDIIPVDFIIFFVNRSIRSFQVKYSSIITPRNVVFLTCFIGCSFIEIVMLCLSFLFDDLNKMNFVLAVFSDNLLLVIQSAILFYLFEYASFLTDFPSRPLFTRLSFVSSKAILLLCFFSPINGIQGSNCFEKYHFRNPFLTTSTFSEQYSLS